MTQDAERQERFIRAVENVLTARQEFFAQLLDPRRDYERECGYPSTSVATADLYKQLYDREHLANRVVEALPRECWQVSPRVQENDTPEIDTEFERAWKDLGSGIGTDGPSWYESSQGSPIWEYLCRADILSGIGHFGVLLLGLDDGQPLEQPVDGSIVYDSPATNAELEKLKALPNLTANEVTAIQKLMGTDAQYFGATLPQKAGSAQAGYYGPIVGATERMPDKPSKKRRNLIYLRVFDESLVQIVRYEWNILNPRFGRPVMYRITLNDPREQHTGVGLPLATVFVHWTRVIHVCDNLKSSEIFGAPRMRPVLNRILDARKVYGASGEGYWRMAFPGISLETHPQLGGDVEIDQASLRNQVENFQNSLQKWLALTGMSAKTLSGSVEDPTAIVDKNIEAICIQLGMPIRVFKGAERGELASSQDDANWNDRLQHRQNFYITPRIIRPFIDRLIMLGVLPEPESYHVVWPSLGSLSESDKASIAAQYTAAIAQYVTSGAENLMAPVTYLTKVLGWDEDEARKALDDAESNQEDMLTTTPPQPDVVENWLLAINFNPNHDAHGRFSEAEHADLQEETTTAIAREATTPPPPGKAYKPNVEADHDNDGVTEAARVGVPANQVPPPPPVPRMPNLTEHERAVETAFREGYEADPDGVAATYRSIAHGAGEPPTFATDDAKVLSSAWSHPDLGDRERAMNRASLNVALHQTANAIAKRAFLQELDALKPGDHIMVTVGGCGAGKGYALKNVPAALALKNASKAVWDSAGDQNATENPWLLREADKRGLKLDFVYVHADPYRQWADGDRGVVVRAADPRDGRMVDAQVFADSYAIGARNHQAFYEANKDKANFVFLENGRDGPRQLDGIPPAALNVDRKDLARFAEKQVSLLGAPPWVVRGATIGSRLWGNP